MYMQCTIYIHTHYQEVSVKCSVVAIGSQHTPSPTPVVLKVASSDWVLPAELVDTTR